MTTRPQPPPLEEHAPGRSARSAKRRAPAVNRWSIRPRRAREGAPLSAH
jgi:hypothetical protein